MSPVTKLSVLRRAGPGALFFLAYLIILLTLIDSKPLWLDELIQLEGTRRANWDGFIQHVLQNAGGAPLGYLGQRWLISIAGFSVLSARLLSAVAGATSLVLFLAIGSRLELRRSTVYLGVSFWAVCPLALRYSLEGRPYMQALVFGLCAVVAQLELVRTRQTRWAIVLTVCLSAAVYSQPFAVFAPLGFSACLILQRRQFRPGVLTAVAYVLAGLSFIPWLMVASGHWREVIVQSYSGSVWTPTVILVLVRECVGDGYPAAVSTIILAAGSVAIAGTRRRDPRLSVLAAAFAAVLLCLAADAWFHYFFAIRQAIYMVPFLLLLAADGAVTLWGNRRCRVAVAMLGMVFITAAIMKDYRHLTDRDEDWGRLSGRLADAVGNGCILIPAGDLIGLYSAFRPEIAQQQCDPGLQSPRIIVPLNRYTDPSAVQLTENALSAKGMTRASTQRVGFATIELFTKQGLRSPPAIQ